MLAAVVMGWLPEDWFGTLVVNVAVLAAVLWFQWVPSDLVA
ncbi:MAG: hypothetical protein ACXWMB_01890 [Candidatus Limnocylindria bacterium]